MDYYDIHITITGNSDMVEINIRQGNEDPLCYGGCSPKDIPMMVETAIEEFLAEMETT